MEIQLHGLLFHLNMTDYRNIVQACSNVYYLCLCYHHFAKNGTQGILDVLVHGSPATSYCGMVRHGTQGIVDVLVHGTHEQILIKMYLKNELD